MAIAKMSPGIVRFYFDSKAAMLVASLQFLAAEFEDQLLVPVVQAQVEPGRGARAAGRSLPRSRNRQPSQSFRLVRVLGRSQLAAGILRHLRTEGRELCRAGARAHRPLDRGHRAVAARSRRHRARTHRGSGNALAGFRVPARRRTSTGRAAKRRCMAYLRSVFPGRFAAARRVRRPRRGARAAGPSLCGMGIRRASAPASLERDASVPDFLADRRRTSPSFARAGDFVTADLGVERVLLIRDALRRRAGVRNSCPDVPHALGRRRAGAASGRASSARRTV